MVTIDPGVELPELVDGQQWVVGAVILDDANRAFAQRRSMRRRMWPGCWDIVGGHVEPGETLIEALGREIFEETGWKLDRVQQVLETYVWETEEKELRYQIDFLTTVHGDLSRPELEWSKISEYAWIDAANLSRLVDKNAPQDTRIRDVIELALASRI